MNSKTILEQIISLLPTIWNHHGPDSEIYTLLKQVAREDVERHFSNNDTGVISLEPFGKIAFPYYNMGNSVDSTNLFDLDELMMFSFYWINRNRYNHVVDAGANLGLHSIVLSKCGYEICAYEPDPSHFKILRNNLEKNGCTNVTPFQAAISFETGESEFIKVLGNTTSSHISGSKQNPYGNLERFTVKVEAIHPLLKWADLIKMDVEGHEKEVILSTTRDQWIKTDALIEIENEQNALAVFEHLTSLGVSMFSQKSNWKLVDRVAEMPTSYHEGTLFVSCRTALPWK